MPKRVICIDDSSAFLLHLSEFFVKEMGFEVVATGQDGVAAVDLYRKHRPDLITLDITMPVKTGAEALKEILAEFPDARIMMISAITGTREMVQCVKQGARAYTEKPILLKNERYAREFKESVWEALGEKPAG